MEILNKLVEEIDDFYCNADKIEVMPCVEPEEIRDHLLEKYTFNEPIALENIMDDVSDMMRKWSLHTTHPRYFGLFNPAVGMSSIIADSLTALYNPQLAAWSHSPAAVEIEQWTLNFLLTKFGFDPKSSAAHFTTGGAEANLSAVLVALTNRFPEYGDKGILSLESQPTIYISSEAHHSFNKIAHSVGLGRNAIRRIKVDDSLKIDIEDLKTQIKNDREKGYTPFMIVATAGTTASGVIDPLVQIGEICISENLWLHVDAAWGGAAILSERLKIHLKGIELADSITCDAHKWFSVSMGAGMFFCKHKHSVERAFSVATNYMPSETNNAIDPYVTSIQWSRRFIGLKVFMALAELGVEGFAKILEHQSKMGDILRERLASKGWKIVNDTPLPVVCFTKDQGFDKVDITKIIEHLYEKRSVWISQTSLNNNIVLRACITNFKTQEEDIDFLMKELEHAEKFNVMRG